MKNPHKTLGWILYGAGKDRRTPQGKAETLYRCQALHSYQQARIVSEGEVNPEPSLFNTTSWAGVAQKLIASSDDL